MFLYFKNQTTYQLINPIKLDTEKQWQQVRQYFFRPFSKTAIDNWTELDFSLRFWLILNFILNRLTSFIIQHQIPLDLLKNKALIKFVIFGDSFHKNIADYQPLLVGFENEDEKIHQMSFPEVVMKEEAVRLV